MVGQHHQLNGHEFEQAPGDGEGQGSLACCSPWGSQRVRHDWATKQKQPLQRLALLHGSSVLSRPPWALAATRVLPLHHRWVPGGTSLSFSTASFLFTSRGTVQPWRYPSLYPCSLLPTGHAENPVHQFSPPGPCHSSHALKSTTWSSEHHPSGLINSFVVKVSQGPYVFNF